MAQPRRIRSCWLLEFAQENKISNVSTQSPRFSRRGRDIDSRNRYNNEEAAQPLTKGGTYDGKRQDGLLGKIEACPLLPICRSPIDIRFECPDEVLARHMPGFHWMTGYGDHLRELGYALKKVSIE